MGIGFHRTVVAGITNGIAIAINLILIGGSWTIVTGVANAIAVTVGFGQTCAGAPVSIDSVAVITFFTCRRVLRSITADRQRAIRVAGQRFATTIALFALVACGEEDDPAPSCDASRK